MTTSTPTEAIHRLKYRYLRCLDSKDWDGFAATLAPDCVADYGPKLAFSSRQEIVDFMQANLGPSVISVHHCHHPEIDVDGDQATGTWALDDTVIVPEFRLLLRGAAFYQDRYRFDGQQWLIAQTGYRRLYEATQNLDDTPSWKLTAGPGID